MKKMNKRFLVGSLMFVLAILLVGGVSQYAFAYKMMGAGPWGDFSRGHHAFKMDVVRALNPMNFTDEQWKKVDEIAGSVRVQGKAFHDTMRKAAWERREELRGMMFAEGFDEEKAKSMIAEIRPEFVAMAESLLRARNELYPMLDESQRGKLDAVLAVVEKHMEEREHTLDRGLPAMMMRRLELNSDQKAKVEAIMKETAPKMSGYAKTLFAMVKSGNAALADGPMSDEQIVESAGKVVDLASEVLMEMGRTRAQVWETLTPEQREEMANMRGPMGRMERGPGRMRK